ncbi:MAG: hypothetical protein NTY99_00780 [DPANN group archaeon]|nr:hypothetical protein [DPANN group archaeon]
MPEAVIPLDIKEISDLLAENFSSAKKNVENLGKAREAAISSETKERDEDEDCAAEEAYYVEQMVASQAGPLKDYYQNPNAENLLELKSKLGKGIHPELSPLGIAYLKNILINKPTRNEDEEETYKAITLQERILATPDKVWEEALTKNAETFGCIKHAPEIEEGLYGGSRALWYYRTLKIEGDTAKLLENLTLLFENGVKEEAEGIIEQGIGFWELFTPTASLGRDIYELNHAKEKGLDGLILYNYPHTHSQVAKEKDAYLMRFFLVQGKDNYPGANHPQDGFYKQFSDWSAYLLRQGVTVTEIDEKIKPIPTEGDWSDIMSKLSKPFSYAKEHIEFPWLKEE